MLFLTIIWTILGGEIVIFTRKFSFWGLKNLFSGEIFHFFIFDDSWFSLLTPALNRLMNNHKYFHKLSFC